ncbi:MAG: hypothetical protein KAS49_04335, partial [Candidatus Cloacimonetes bacterium]|nr:hypothetical protein [Candidatus Cloacimonadota bacterium]
KPHPLTPSPARRRGPLPLLAGEGWGEVLQNNQLYRTPQTQILKKKEAFQRIPLKILNAI